MKDACFGQDVCRVGFPLGPHTVPSYHCEPFVGSTGFGRQGVLPCPIPQCLEHIPMLAALSIQILAGHDNPRPASNDRNPSAAAAASVAPTTSASPEDRNMLCSVRLQLFMRCPPIVKHRPDVDFRVRGRPAQSVSQNTSPAQACCQRYSKTNCDHTQLGRLLHPPADPLG